MNKFIIVDGHEFLVGGNKYNSFEVHNNCQFIEETFTDGKIEWYWNKVENRMMPGLNTWIHKWEKRKIYKDGKIITGYIKIKEEQNGTKQTVKFQ